MLETLQIVWFVLIAVLFTGFFFFEGFDYGVGMLLPIVKDESERDQLIRSIAPVWDGNEVWMITAGGAMFAAFPHVYATMFSAFYLALFLMLVALILRGIAFELRGKIDSKSWRTRWEWAIAFGSYIPAFLWGVVIADLIFGLPIVKGFQFSGTFLDLVTPAAIVGGLTFVAIFLAHGAMFASLRMQDEKFIHKLRSMAASFGKTAIGCCVFLLAAIWMKTSILNDKPIALILFILAAGSLFFALKCIGDINDRLAFFSGSIAIIFFTTAVFTGIFPNLMSSSLSSDWSLTIYNASSTEHTLKLMTIAAGVFVPIVLIYQGFTYWIFRKRISVVNDSSH